eukprot:SAG25_NODE_1936_length_2124_cov_1.622222_2_plen_53_part_00
MGVILLGVCVFPRESQNPILVALLYELVLLLQPKSHKWLGASRQEGARSSLT